jgi:hypothetical protein
MTIIVGVPPLVEKQPIFQDCLTVLDGAFVDGNNLRFELGHSGGASERPLRPSVLHAIQAEPLVQR